MEKLGRFNRDIPDLVLSKFRIRDLMQMKCVSKLWRDLISDLISNRSFALNHSQKQLLSGFFFRQKSLLYDFPHPSYVSAGREDEVAPTLLRNPLDFLPPNSVLVSSCNGLVCCRSYSFWDILTIHVGNPLTREWVEFNWYRINGRADAIMLSFDPARDITDDSTDFKVLMVWESPEEQYPSFHLYSSKTKRWKFLYSDETYILSEYYDLYHTECVCVKGAMYWCTHYSGMLAFDAENELAYTVSTPVQAYEFGRGEPVACIGESDGELQFVMLSKEGLRMWVLEDLHGEKWSSLRYERSLADIKYEHAEFSLDLQEAMRLHQLKELKVDALALKDGVLVLRVADNVFLYDMGTDRINRIAHVTELGNGRMFDPKVPPYMEVPKVIPYSMSLVPLNRP
ncbi:unnamed protein product [Linum trigynum]|uniref:F-box associated beta-propeller type 1 domain-containing protein n=1 Tax=Linum trigynum TaxID=586398 RepID=A0AAV2DFH8_9ROSI